MEFRAGWILLAAAFALPPAWAQETEPADAPAEAPEAPEAAAAIADPAPADTAQAPVETVPVNTGEDQSVPAPSDSTKLDDLVVTSQKRKQSIQDVPISVSAMNAEFIHEQGLTDIRDAMALMPNVKMEEAGFFTAPRIRGFTFNNNNKAFEPPVGIVIDGVPYTRPEYFMMTLFDIDRVEVMRGPQGTTFGKNTTAGLVHLMTKDPSGGPEGRLQLQGGELARKHIEAAYGGNLIEDVVDFRVAGLYDERDGFITNTYNAVDPTVPDAYKNRKRTGGRMKLAFPDLWGSQLKVGAEQLTLLSGGAAFEYVEVTDDFEAAARRYDPNFDSIRGNYIMSEDFPGFRDVHITTYNGQWDYSLGDWEIVAVGGHSLMTQKLQLDVDFTPAPSTIGFGSDRSPTTTLELRTASPELDGLFGLQDLFGLGLGSSDILVGVFHEQRAILDSVFRFGLDQQATVELVQGANGDTGTGGGDFAGLTAADAAAGGYEEVIQNFNQRAEAVGAFSHFKWQFLPAWSAEVGVRYTTEKKDADWNLFFTTNGGTAAGNPVATRLGFIPFTDALTRNEDNVQPKFSLGYAPWDNIKLFAHWTRGYKGGGYNAFAYRNVKTDPQTNTTTNERTTEDLEYEPEITTEKGVDIKTTLFGGSMRANLSLYDMTAKDFQVLVRNNPQDTIGLGTTQVANAEGARAMGTELDLTWLVTDWFSVIGASGLNDTEYSKFTQNDCPSEVPNAQRTAAARSSGNSPCDATGKRFPYAPKWNNALSLVSNIAFERIPLLGWALGGSGLDLFMSVTGEHQTWSHLDTDLSKRESKVQPEFYRLKANVGIGNPAKRWTLRVIGENLNGATTWIRAGDIFQNNIAASQNEPRLIFAQFQQEF
ncbi:MAG TPA: TonB-dependent receptor [Verrucomicrobiae bacterium]|nr:TonB-dependent receptor [Verrucomicrobiae bacterium]